MATTNFMILSLVVSVDDWTNFKLTARFALLSTVFCGFCLLHPLLLTGLRNDSDVSYSMGTFLVSLKASHDLPK